MAENTQVARTGTKTSFMAYISSDTIANQIKQATKGKSGDRFISAMLSAVQANPALQECSNKSIVNAALLGEALNLTPSPQLGQYYMVPFNNSKKGIKEAQFQLGYKGYIQLAIRSGFYKKLNAVAIKEGELVQYSPLDEEIEINLIEDEEERENAVTTGYYAMFGYTNGFKKTLYWSKAKMESHAIKYSMGYKAKKGYTFWEKDFDTMALKTMLRQIISKWGIMSIEMQNAFRDDMAVVDDKGNRNYVDSVSLENEVQAEIEQNANTEDFKEVIDTRKTTVNESTPADPGF